MNKFSSFKFQFYFLLFICALFILTPFLYAYLFCVPYGDDFDEATKTMFLFDAPGAIYDVIRNWLTWSGRYAYHFFAVFLGAAVFHKPLLVFVNLLPIIIFFCSISQFFSYFTVLPPRLFACFACLLLYCNFSYLWVFYSFMDSFSIGLQWVIYFIFFYFSCKLLLKESEKRTYHFTLLSGILAIGIYEISALAVLWTTIACLIAKGQLKLKHPSADTFVKIIFASPFLKLFSYFTIAIIISFLAPGNFFRTTVRPVALEIKLTQLTKVLPLWAQIQATFFSSILALQVICLTLLFFLFKREKLNNLSFSITDFLVVIITWILFSLMTATLLAFTDMPLGSTPKFDALLHLFQSLAFGLVLFISLSRSKLNVISPVIRKIFFIFLVSIFLGSALLTSNFKKVAINAANGELLRFCNYFMQIEKTLSEYASNGNISKQWPKYGIWGEIENSHARETFIMPELPEVIVDEWPTSVFPVLRNPIFNRASNKWPNPRASWFYRVGSIKSQPPNPNSLFKRLETKQYFSYCLSPSLINAGIEQAYLVYTKNHLPKPLLWIAIKTIAQNLKNVSILVPSHITYMRLLPVGLQRYLYDRYKSLNKFDLSFTEKLLGPVIKPFSFPNYKGWLIAPLFGWPENPPEFFYISLNDAHYEKTSLSYSSSAEFSLVSPKVN